MIEIKGWLLIQMSLTETDLKEPKNSTQVWVTMHMHVSSGKHKIAICFLQISISKKT